MHIRVVVCIENSEGSSAEIFVTKLVETVGLFSGSRCIGLCLFIGFIWRSGLTAGRQQLRKQKESYKFFHFMTIPFRIAYSFVPVLKDGLPGFQNSRPNVVKGTKLLV